MAALPDVGPARAAALRRLGLRCVADLLRHLPMRYERELGEQSIAEAGETVGAEHGRHAILSLQGEVVTVRNVRGRRGRFEATLQDATGSVLLTWFNTPWMRGRLHPGARIRVSGKITRYGDYLQMVNPRWAPIAEDAAAPPGAPDEERLIPVYPASEEIRSDQIETLIGAVLEPALAGLADHLPADYRAERALPALADAYRMIHRPEDLDEAAAARRRLAFDELLMLQLAVFLKRRHRRDALVAPALAHNPAIDRHITARFPFELTESQRAVIAEIAGDLTRTVPMNRLLQGDVGAGKTVVALYAMLLAVAARAQAALMAPTELLAEQHHASITAMLEGSNLEIALLTGSLGKADRAALLERVAGGGIDVVIGTHALLTEDVAFHRLAVVVVDEQHRFGVHQRARLRTKSKPGAGVDGRVEVPHTLVMTATPIPRTLSLTVFGDLDVSTIRDLPPGRRPVITKRLPLAQAARAYEYVRKRVDAGDQAYVVVPAIDESEAGLKDVRSHLEHLRSGPLSGCRLGAVHGRLKRAERDAVMQSFREGDLDVLVATTVIEVGVDVPGATIMVIEHADRFGLAQLHQLRGRVGRAARQSLCVLIADPVTEEGEARLHAIAETNDGFEIAERDLEIRGPGELFGARQSGLPPFHAAVLPRDLDLLRLARRDAAEWIDADPDLSSERNALLRTRLWKAHGRTIGLGDVG